MTATANLPDKKVTFICRDGVWEMELEQKSNQHYFTDRDINKIAMFLSNRTAFRRRAALLFKAEIHRPRGVMQEVQV